MSGMACTSPRTAYMRAGFSPRPRHAPGTLVCPLACCVPRPCACSAGSHDQFSRPRANVGVSFLVPLVPNHANLKARGVGRLPTLLGPASVLRVPHHATPHVGWVHLPTLLDPTRIVVPTLGTGRGPPAHAIPWG